MKFIWCFITILWYRFELSIADSVNFSQKIIAAIKSTDQILDHIFVKWQIKEYPNFLKSVSMSHTGWEVLKLKFESKILSTALGKKEKFVVSFMGSSVTAGHDTLFNITFPTLVGNIMAPPFQILGIDFESRNAAMGNNPCLPYDVCVHAFAGKDADIVHWEQSFNCFGSRGDSRVPFEHFIRESLTLQNQAIVVFSHSGTPNWKSSDCENVKKPYDNPDKSEFKWIEAIKKDPMKVVTEMNPNFQFLRNLNQFSAMTELFKTYKYAGVQTWNHGLYEVYKCHGPYVPDWGCCSASWHPSILGHELRADHYSYFWLLIFKDALLEISKTQNYEKMLSEVEMHIQKEHKYIPKEAMYPSNFKDGLTCYTTYEPLADPDLDLRNLVLSKSEIDGKKPFQIGIMEDFIDKNIVIKSRAQGYKDYKYCLYGNNDSVPLSLKLEIDHDGIVQICEPPGNWGHLPKGFSSFYKDNSSKAYLSSDFTSYKDFVFDFNKTIELKIVDPNKGTQFICAEIGEKLPKGKHVLTMVPQTQNYIMFSYLIIP